MLITTPLHNNGTQKESQRSQSHWDIATDLLQRTINRKHILSKHVLLSTLGFCTNMAEQQCRPHGIRPHGRGPHGIRPMGEDPMGDEPMGGDPMGGDPHRFCDILCAHLWNMSWENNEKTLPKKSVIWGITWWCRRWCYHLIYIPSQATKLPSWM